MALSHNVPLHKRFMQSVQWGWPWVITTAERVSFGSSDFLFKQFYVLKLAFSSCYTEPAILNDTTSRSLVGNEKSEFVKFMSVCNSSVWSQTGMSFNLNNERCFEFAFQYGKRQVKDDFPGKCARQNTIFFVLFLVSKMSLNEAWWYIFLSFWFVLT